MAFMKKDVNFGLLVMIIVSIALFSGFSVYYQTTFKDVSLEYQQKLEQLGQVTEELGDKRQELNETYSLRVKAEEDKRALDERYQDVSGENALLSSELISTKSDLAAKSSELVETKNSLARTQDSLDSAKMEVGSLKAKRDNLQSDKDELCTYLESQGLSHDEC
jgi:chromosome segregation ATPase